VRLCLRAGRGPRLKTLAPESGGGQIGSSGHRVIGSSGQSLHSYDLKAIPGATIGVSLTLWISPQPKRFTDCTAPIGDLQLIMIPEQTENLPDTTVW